MQLLPRTRVSRSRCSAERRATAECCLDGGGRATARSAGAHTVHAFSWRGVTVRLGDCTTVSHDASLNTLREAEEGGASPSG